jgi:hypothetical protein
MCVFQVKLSNYWVKFVCLLAGLSLLLTCLSLMDTRMYFTWKEDYTNGSKKAFLLLV